MIYIYRGIDILVYVYIYIFIYILIVSSIPFISSNIINLLKFINASVPWSPPQRFTFFFGAEELQFHEQCAQQYLRRVRLWMDGATRMSQ